MHIQVEVEAVEPAVARNGAGIVRSCIAQSEQKVMGHTKRLAHITGPTPIYTDATALDVATCSYGNAKARTVRQSNINLRLECSQYQEGTQHCDYLSQTTSACF